ncbi:tRNA uridine-5-carboxymethylaminomethyl(34) synthesis GTPase MnmE [uncultured Thiodictyon sp.]|uniref:tRNA uridine-5-carboxymethylaminomethyl(34) synthesis GTPase MnmE n=1 Tax=uncultured Thiodictyon sp. TaxID=1846217 RepID=UPI0025FACEBC|nr:tRNA uridine-5-carboxymethylaminomethyl(34) synthesis GTPase MnmE [uncultured Thiodictyon sp.]
MVTNAIVAVATPPGVGGLGVVRVSGPGVARIARAILGRNLKPRLASLCSFRDGSGDVIDQGIAIFFRGPHSFTGEDVLELQGHGGPVVMDLLLARCLELGARLARPGEFTERAYLNGKLDLVQAEATADLIESSTSLAARLAMRSLQGLFSRRIRVLVDDLVRLRTAIEATLDFPEDIIDPQSLVRFRFELERLVDSAQQTLSQARQGERVRDGLTVVIAGRPNVGKSSLLNALLEVDAAIVTPIPGTTRDLLRCELQIDGLPVKLIDTAGLREAVEPVEQEGVRRARGQLELADLILWVYDHRQGVEAAEISGLPPNVPMTLVQNKIDLDLHVPGDILPDGIVPLRLSALTGLGIKELRQHIKSRVHIEGLGEGSFVARRRHLDALQRGLICLNAARSVLEVGLGLEVIALELLEAQHAFGEITGEFTPDDLLGRIFASFCIGK